MNVYLFPINSLLSESCDIFHLIVWNDSKSDVSERIIKHVAFANVGILFMCIQVCLTVHKSI